MTRVLRRLSAARTRPGGPPHRWALDRLPLRLRLVLGFTLVMATALALAGLAAELTFTAALNRSLRDSLTSRATDIAALVSVSRSGLEANSPGRLPEQRGSFAQVLDPSGRVLAATGSTSWLASHPLLTPAELARTQHGPLLFDRGERAGRGDAAGDPVRLLARPVAVAATVSPGEPSTGLHGGPPGQWLAVVVGASLEGHDQALDALRRELVVGGPALLALAGLAGYGLATAALRPVEAMRRRAAAISLSGSGGHPGQRLPLPPARDELARLGETLNELLGRVEEAIARERGFVADAGHELRTPLALLKTELELARRRPRSRAELERVLGSATEETNRLAGLAEDLLLLAQADQVGLPLRLTEVTVGDLLTQTAGRFAAQVHDPERPLLLETSGADAIRLLADRARVEQALSIMIDNALRHGAGPVRLFAATANQSVDRDAHAWGNTDATAIADRVVELHVTDEGDGFPPSFVARAFERFTRGDQARGRDGGRGGGTGLGLAIAEAIARAHHGSAHAGNRSPRGADVWLTLPGHHAPEAEATQQDEQQTDDRGAHPHC